MVQAGKRIIMLAVAVAFGTAVSTKASDLVAEDQTPTGTFTTAAEVAPILAATTGNWIAVREWNGEDLIYVTHLWAWRCGMLQMEVAVNDGPAEIWPLPDCHIDTKQPNAILEEDGLPYRSFALRSVDKVSVTLTLDDLSEQTAEFSRAAVLIP